MGITLSPTEGLVTTVSGVGFTLGSPIALTWAGNPIATIPTVVTAGADETFIAIVVAPTVTPGGYMMGASDTAARSAQAAFSIPDLTGAEGAEGPAGEPGPAGPAGTAGPPGTAVRYIEEGMRFAVLVLDTHLDPIAGAPISLTEAGGDAVIPLGQTDENGFVVVSAPEVEAARSGSTSRQLRDRSFPPGYWCWKPAPFSFPVM
ncbi:hypothetical protein M1N86_01615 [Dehalococcoidia bacterium]|nr:hypothetical protein [Dehalococcoidia bacterium]